MKNKTEKTSRLSMINPFLGNCSTKKDTFKFNKKLSNGKAYTGL